MKNNNLQERFLKYISFDTQSDQNSETIPSTLKQKLLGLELVKELHNMGISNAYIDEYSYVYAKVNSSDSKVSIGLIAHLDTATEVSGKDVKANIIDNYNGEVIKLKNNITIDPKEYSSLNKAINHTLVTTDGTTLLGADDKAGVAIIMEVVCEVLKQPKLYPNIYICFTPDEEIGRGADKFNYEYFKVDFAYTLDGGPINTINCENFNAAEAKLTFNGLSIHPGSAKNKMINSQLVAIEFQNMLPQTAIPSMTEKYEGFNHLIEMNGDVSKTTMRYIIRNHNPILFSNQILEFKRITDILNKKYGNATIELTITETYRNMYELIMKKKEILEYPKASIMIHNLTPELEPIRGGTDGARLTYEGILCPNLGTGSYNHHGPKEYADVNEMSLMVEVVKTMLKQIK